MRKYVTLSALTAYKTRTLGSKSRVYKFSKKLGRSKSEYGEVFSTLAIQPLLRYLKQKTEKIRTKKTKR